MAAIETIDGEDFINVEFKVGKGAVNGWSDVMAVQSFLKFFEEQYAERPRPRSLRVRFPSQTELPTQIWQHLF